MTDTTRKWTPEEDEILRQHYVKIGPTALHYSGLIDRTIRALKDRSTFLKLRQGSPRGRRANPDIKNGEGIGIACSVWDLAKR